MSEDGPGPGDLVPDIAREIDQVAHFGSARRVKELVAQAGALLEDDPGRAADLLAQAKAKAPRSAAIRDLLGTAYYRLGRFREAARELAAFRRLSGRRDRDPELADCERALGRPERALELLEGLETEEGLPEEVVIEGLIVGAGALVDVGRVEDAVRRLKRGPLDPPAVRPPHLRLWYALADALERAGRRREARMWWDAIYADDPDFYDVARRRLGLTQ